ncbi:MAG: hypothetical protein QM650_04270 [Microlunatus sp.]
MSSAQVFESAAPVDAVLSRLVETQSWLSDLAAERDTADPVSEATRVDRIAILERLQAGIGVHARLGELVVRLIQPPQRTGRLGDCPDGVQVDG